MSEKLRSIFTRTESGEIAIRISSVEGCEQDALSCGDVSSFKELLERSVGINSCSKNALRITGQAPSLTMVFNDDVEVLALVADASSVDDWNTFFNLPTNGTPFTSVSSTLGNTRIVLRGGENIAVDYGKFATSTSILSFVDTGCVTSILEDAFKEAFAIHTIRCSLVDTIETSVFHDCTSLTELYLPELVNTSSAGCNGCIALPSASFPKVTSIGTSFFNNCVLLQSVSLPLCLSIGSFAMNNCDALNTVYIPLCANLGGTVEDDSVFDNANERYITITIPASLMTNNGGNPDGDIQYLQVEDNPTIIQV